MGTTVDRATALERFAARFEQASDSGTPLSEDVLEQALDLLFPRPSPWVARIGPVYATGQLTRWLPGRHAGPITDEAVRDRRRNGRLIGFKTADGHWAWPAFQFRVRTGRLEPDPQVLALWQLLPWQDADQLELISWLTGRRTDLDGLSPLDHLRVHGLDDTLRSAAQRAAMRIGA